tara:strand:+ start:755 stop:901 length:147 start_codon:yes stop_codon:yes gene_type:complete
MSNQDLIDAVNNLAEETNRLRLEVKDLKEINSELKTEVYELGQRMTEL